MVLSSLPMDKYGLFIIATIGWTTWQMLCFLLSAGILRSPKPIYIALSGYLAYRALDVIFIHHFGVTTDGVIDSFIKNESFIVFADFPWSRSIVLEIAAALFFSTGLFVFFRRDHWTEKPLCRTSAVALAIPLCFFPLFSLHTVIDRQVARPLKVALEKQLPIACFIPEFHGVDITFGGQVKPLPIQKEVEEFLSEKSFTVAKQPNIYLIVLETFRADHITPEIAPHLHRFKEENTSFPNAVSTATATSHSWFSLYNSRWAYERDVFYDHEWELGSLPLNIFDKMGYRIHMLANPCQGFRGIGVPEDPDWVKLWKFTFMPTGKNPFSSDCFDFPGVGEIETSLWAPCDKRITDRLLESIEAQEKEGNFHIVSLDACHYPYSWLEEEGTRFQPSFSPSEMEGKSIYLITLGRCRKEKHANRVAVANGYRNAIHGVDQLFGRFLEKLRERDEYEDSVIIVMGDHGESLFEKGFRFHGGSAVRERIRIPLYFKFGKDSGRTITATNSTPVDIFPTLFDYLGLQEYGQQWYVGQSLFEKESSYTVVSRPNGQKYPKELTLINDQYKLFCEFSHPSKTINSNGLKIIKVTDLFDKEQHVARTPEELHQFVMENFQKELNTIFTNTKKV
jgi:hypothetical protein